MIQQPQDQLQELKVPIQKEQLEKWMSHPFTKLFHKALLKRNEYITRQVIENCSPSSEQFTVRIADAQAVHRITMDLISQDALIDLLEDVAEFVGGDSDDKGVEE